MKKKKIEKQKATNAVQCAESAMVKSILEDVDLSVYLVTDAGLNHPSRTLIQTIEDAISGGTKIVQLREKDLSTENFVALAKKVHDLTKKYNVPLIINDSIDVVLATDAEGLHIGQDDTPLPLARARLGSSKIIGVSVQTLEEVKKAVEDGADYIGIGPCFKTSTKSTEYPELGHIGLREMLESIPFSHPIKTIGIGGLRVDNAQRIVYSSIGANGRGLDGVAVVSAIVAAPDAKSAASRLLDEVNRARGSELHEIKHIIIREVLESVPKLLTTLRQECPLIHQITNFVVMNETANCTLALGGSPVMATKAAEAEDLSKVVASLVLNMGTLEESFVECMLEAAKFANAQSKPVVMDPVAVGATTFRRDMIKHLLNNFRVDIIKGNCGEICALAEIVGCPVKTEGVQMRGVDSVGELANPEEIVKSLANREKCVVVMSGKVDYISDGTNTVAIENGHPYLAKITGSGCMATSVIACFAGISPKDHFAAAVAGMLCMNLAGEHAANRDDVRGPGTFRAAFIDELANLNAATILPEFKVMEIN